MLWYKGWLETRIKFLFAFAFIGFLLYMMQSPHKSPATVSIFLPGTAPIFVFMVCVLVAGAGIATQPPFQATKGLHGSMLFTLSLPVSRLRLLAVRATLGWLEMAVLVGFLCCGIWTLSPIVRILNTPAEMFEFAATLLACASSLYGLSVLLATFLDDQWRVWGTMLCIGAVWWLSLHNSLPAFTDILHAMGKGSPLIAHTMPWPAMAFSLALAVVFFYAALKVAQSREY